MVHQYMPAVLCGKQQQKSSDAICNCKNKVQFPFFFFANSMSGFLLILEFAKCTITDSLVINPPHLSSFFY